MRCVLEVGEFKFFDVIYQRYSDPLPLLDQMAATGHLTWYVRNLINTYYEDETERTLWDLYVHNPFEKRSFDEFKRDIMRDAQKKARNKKLQNNPRATARAVENSRRIIESFGMPVESN